MVEILCCRPGNGRGNIRAQHQGAALAIEKLIELPGRNRSHLSGKYVKKFKGRGLDALIPLFRQHLVELLLKLKLLYKFTSVNIPDAFRGM